VRPVVSQHKTDAQLNHSQTELCGTIRLLFHARQVSTKNPLPGGDVSVSTSSRDRHRSDRRSANQNLRAMRHARNRVHQPAGSEDTAIANTRFHFGIPSLRDSFAGEVNDGIHGVDAVIRRSALQRVQENDAIAVRFSAPGLRLQTPT